MEDPESLQQPGSPSRLDPTASQHRTESGIPRGTPESTRDTMDEGNSDPADLPPSQLDLFLDTERPPERLDEASDRDDNVNTNDRINDRINDRFVKEKFQEAFGAPLLNSEGGPDSELRKIWWKATALRGKQYQLPGGNVGTRFVNLLAVEIERCTAKRQPSEREFIFTALVLQRNKMVKKAKDIRPLLTRRMDMWEAGQLKELLQEAQRCDRQLTTSITPMSPEQVERTFARMMMQGRVPSAVRLLTDRLGGGVLDPGAEAQGKDGGLQKTVFDILQEKHPPQKHADPRAFIQCEELPLLEDVDITSSHIEQVARRLFGSAGPSGTDSEQWRSFLLRFGNASSRLREAVAASTRLHANQVVPWDDMRALLARRGIALDKNPGVRPIGIGECRQRLEAKAMALATGTDLQEVCAADQLCAGAKAGVEAAVHAMREVFEDPDTECLLLVDASNAFNRLSRPAALWNCRVLWPRCSRYLFNSYRGFAVVVLRGADNCTHVILSREGTTQGCPLAMLMYAAGIQPLIAKLKDPLRHLQNWFADDSSCGGRLQRVHDWFLALMALGPAFGYYPEPSKSVLIVKPDLLPAARALFESLQVHVTLSSRYLGGCIGEEAGVKAYVAEKVSSWVASVARLSSAAKAFPHAAYCALTRSLTSEWTYVQRVVNGCDDEFADLRDTLQQHFTPALLGREILDREHPLLALPAKYGGLAIPDPVSTASSAFSVSVDATATLRRGVVTGDRVNIHQHHEHCRRVTGKASRARDERASSVSQDLITGLPPLAQRTLSRIVKGNASGWLTVLPLRQEGYDLSSTQFRDQLAIRYGYEPSRMPSICDGCGVPFSLQHGLDCHKGGLIKRGHNDLRDADAKLADLAWGGVVIEPVLVPADDQNSRPALQADWSARGVWEGNRVALFDNRIVDANAPSYRQSSWDSVARKAAEAKKKKYARAAEELRSSFTPLVCSTDAVLHREYAAYQKRLASQLASRWEKPYSVVMAWVRVQTQISIIRAVDLRLRGSRRRLTGLTIQDGAGLGVGH